MDRDISTNLAKLGLSAHGLAELDVPFIVKEAWRTIEQLPSDKALGPYVFMGCFCKSSWPIIRDDIMAVALAI